MLDINEYRDGISTKKLAEIALTTPGNVRVRLCETGSFYGIKPLKLPSGRLLWPADALNRLAGCQSKKTRGQQ